MAEKMKLLLIDDHVMLRSGLRVLASGFDEVDMVADGG